MEPEAQEESGSDFQCFLGDFGAISMGLGQPNPSGSFGNPASVTDTGLVPTSPESQRRAHPHPFLPLLHPLPFQSSRALTPMLEMAGLEASGKAGLCRVRTGVDPVPTGITVGFSPESGKEQRCQG